MIDAKRPGHGSYLDCPLIGVALRILRIPASDGLEHQWSI
jgi:hypothetical protein